MRQDNEELAWAAGFYDGEGCTYLQKSNGRNRYVSIGITQNDREVLDRFRAAVGLGKVYIRPNSIPMYRVTKIAEAKEVLRRMWPYLSSVKRDQAIEKLAASDGFGKKAA